MQAGYLTEDGISFTCSKLKLLWLNFQILKRAKEIGLLLLFFFFLFPLEYNLLSFCSIFQTPLFHFLRKGVSELHVVSDQTK